MTIRRKTPSGQKRQAESFTKRIVPYVMHQT